MTFRQLLMIFTVSNLSVYFRGLAQTFAEITSLHDFGKKDILGYRFLTRLNFADEFGFMCMDGLSRLEDGAKANFPNVIVVYLIRNSLK